MTHHNFEGKVALITGASSGIGAATARAFAKAGAQVLLADVQGEAGEALAEELGANEGRAHFTLCDVRKESEIMAAVRTASDRFGSLHIAFNNAGIEGESASTNEVSNENWEDVIAINLRGVFWCMKHEIPMMRAGGGGAIVNTASIAGVLGFPGLSPYVASKHGVIGLTKSAALEYARENIRINAVCPGAIDTPMINRYAAGSEEARAGLMAEEPIGRMGRPEEIANAVLWLASEGSSFVTGHPLIVDGGWVAG